MTIAFDASSSNFTGWGGSVTVPHTVSGENRIIIAGCTSASASDKVSGVTYNGVAMTRARAEIVSSASVYLYYLIAPDTGTHDVVFTFTTSDVASNCIVASFTGVDQTTPIYSSTGNSNSYSASPRSLAVTTTSGGVAVDFIGSSDVRGITFSVGSGQTGINPFANAKMSYETDATSMDWTWADGERSVSQSSVSLKAAEASGATITGNLGTTTAFGFAAAILASVTIACSMGGATASGHQATISTGSNVTISCAVGTATASGLSGTVTSSGSATITTDAFKNNTGTVLTALTVPKLSALKLSDMTLAASWSSQATNGSGVLSLTSAGLTAATDYLLVTASTDGLTVGVKKYTAT